MSFDINSSDKKEHEKALLMKFQKETLVEMLYHWAMVSNISIDWASFKAIDDVIKTNHKIDKYKKVTQIMDELYSETEPEKARAKVLRRELDKLMPTRKQKRRSKNGS